jgi:hypothetical protein
MNHIKIPLVLLLTVVLTGLVSIGITTAQGTSALERGYRTGYSDGYSAGVGDAGNKAARNYQNKEEYQLANRSFNDTWGTIEDYRDGYQQGFESGYGAGYDHQQFDSALPTGLRRRGASPNGSGTTPVNGAGTTPVNQTGTTTVNETGTTAVTTSPDTTAAPDNSDRTAVQTAASLNIPRNTILSLELMTPLSTDATQRNDPFKARVTQPAEFANYIVEGRVTEVKRPGKVKGVAQLQLSFDNIRSTDNRVAGLHAELLEVVPMNSDSSPDVDSEGAVRGRDSSKDDAAKIGGASGIGAIIGVIAGGGKGAAIGAIIGAGAGTAGTMTQRGRDIRLEQGQQLKIRTSSDTSGL